MGSIDECGQLFDLGGDRGADSLGIFCSARFAVSGCRRHGGFGVFFCLAGFLFQIVLLQIVLGNELFDQLAAVVLRFACREQALQALANGDQGGSDGVRTGGQQLAQDQCREVALLFGQSVGVFLLQKGRDALVQRLLVVGGVERLGERLALGVLDVLQHVTAQCAFGEAGKALTQFVKARSAVHELLAEGSFVAEQVLVDQGRQAIKLHQRVLQRRGGEQ